MASPLENELIRSSRKSNRGVMTPDVQRDYLDEFDPEDMGQTAFSRQGLASNYQDEPLNQAEATGGVEGGDDTLSDMDYESTEPAQEDAQEDAGDLADEAGENEAPLAKLYRWSDPVQVPNIAAELEQEKLSEISLLVIEETQIDDDSRSEWLKAANAGLDMALQRTVEKSFPWLKAANVIFPLITKAADQFGARAYPAIIKDRNVVKGQVIGDDNGIPMPANANLGLAAFAGGAAPEPMGDAPSPDGSAPPSPMMGHNGGPPVQEWLVPPGEKASRAKRIADHMSYQHLEVMEEWEEDTDKLVNILPVVGCLFRKTYYDPAMGRPVSLLVMPKDLIVNYWAKSLELAPRRTEVLKLYPYEIQEHINSGFFIDQDYGLPVDGDANDKDSPHTFYEQHRRLDLDDDGYPEPYIVTVHKDSFKVARVVAGFDRDGVKTATGSTEIAKIVPVSYYTKYDFLPNREGGLYGHGFAHNLRTLNESINSVLNMLLDAGILQNTGGGWIGKGVGMMSGAVKFRPGEWKVLNALGQDIRAAIVPHQHNDPSNVLFQLLGMMIAAGEDISSVKDVLTGEIKAQTMSPTVFMALVDQGLKVFTAIYQRIYRGLKQEFKKVYRINRLHIGEGESYQQGDQFFKISKADYEAGAAVVPVSDPKMVVDAQKMARVDVLMQFKDDPLVNGKEIRKRAIEAGGFENPEELLKVEPAPNPELMVKVATLELNRISAMADVLVKMSQAIKNMADADAKVNEPFIAWAQTSMQQVKDEYERVAASAGQSGDKPSSPAGSAGTQPPAMGAMAAPPDNQGVPPLPQ